MKHLTYKTYQLQSPFAVPELVERMSMSVEPVKQSRNPFSFTHAPFQGWVSASGFQLRRVIHYRNTLLPLIEGQFVSSNTGTLIRIQINVSFVALAVGLIWFGVLGLATGAGLVALIHDGDWTPLIFFGGIGVCAFLMTYFLFLREVNKAKQFMEVYSTHQAP